MEFSSFGEVELSDWCCESEGAGLLCENGYGTLVPAYLVIIEISVAWAIVQIMV